MTDPMVIEADESKTKRPETNDSDQNQSAKKSLKRKRASVVDSLTTEEREARINALYEELEGLFKYYKEVLDEKVNLNLGDCGSSNSAIACLLEESNLSLSKLVGEIYEKTKETESRITVASVKSSMLFIGQRSLYGVPNADADVLEDEIESCLWCWEVKKSILDKLGLSSSPDKDVGRRKSIATFYSKRCLPPTRSGNNIDPTETSPNSFQKFSAAVESQQAVTNNYQYPPGLTRLRLMLFHGSFPFLDLIGL